MSWRARFTSRTANYLKSTLAEGWRKFALLAHRLLQSFEAIYLLIHFLSDFR